MSSIDLEIDSLSIMLNDMEKNNPFKSRVSFPKCHKWKERCLVY